MNESFIFNLKQPCLNRGVKLIDNKDGSVTLNGNRFVTCWDCEDYLELHQREDIVDQGNAEKPAKLLQDILDVAVDSCRKCKGWGGQGTSGTIVETKGNYRTCMLDIFGDIDNPEWKPMFVLKITSGHGRGNIGVHRDFCCVNFNPDFD